LFALLLDRGEQQALRPPVARAAARNTGRPATSTPRSVSYANGIGLRPISVSAATNWTSPSVSSPHVRTPRIRSSRGWRVERTSQRSPSSSASSLFWTRICSSGSSGGFPVRSQSARSRLCRDSLAPDLRHRSGPAPATSASSARKLIIAIHRFWSIRRVDGDRAALI
jgi:hypothetical protein